MVNSRSEWIARWCGSLCILVWATYVQRCRGGIARQRDGCDPDKMAPSQPSNTMPPAQQYQHLWHFSLFLQRVRGRGDTLSSSNTSSIVVVFCGSRLKSHISSTTGLVHSVLRSCVNPTVAFIEASLFFADCQQQSVKHWAVKSG